MSTTPKTTAAEGPPATLGSTARFTELAEKWEMLSQKYEQSWASSQGAADWAISDTFGACAQQLRSLLERAR